MNSPRIAAFQRIYDGINADDLDAAVASYAPDVHYEETSLYWDLHSRQEVRENFGPWFSYAALHAELVDGIETGQRAAVQWRFSGEIRAALPGVWPTQAIGRQFSFLGTTMATFNEEGLISHAVEVWNLAELLKQVGTLPA
ncbi:nuclear transport factor 2 family protein [Streptomyces sp. NPDC014636]|uniref:nuclear transport factor 2 family protein n=1 Tax=Streptomyces sp. NPDC014636 TaxID=3364876 RepID=UPI0036F647D7